jgi:hypothetical protein
MWLPSVKVVNFFEYLFDFAKRLCVKLEQFFHQEMVREEHIFQLDA